MKNKMKLIFGGLFVIGLLAASNLMAQNVSTNPFYRTYRTPSINQLPVRREIILRSPTQQELINIRYQRLLRQNNVGPMYKVENGDFSQVQQRANYYQQARRTVIGNRANSTRTTIANGILWSFQFMQGLDPQLRRPNRTYR